MKITPSLLAVGWILFLTAVPAWLTLQNQFGENHPKDAQKKPLVELVDFSYATVDDKGKQQEVLGKFGYHFADFDGVRGLFLRIRDGGETQTLSCKIASFDKEKITLDDEIVYDRGDGSKLQTKNAIYTKADKILQAQGGFVLQSKRVTVNGQAIRYDLANKTASAETIKTTIRTDK